MTGMFKQTEQDFDGVLTFWENQPTNVLLIVCTFQDVIAKKQF